MRFALPERISLWHAGCFALLLALCQLALRTDPVFSLFCVAFILTATVAFNIAGGLTRPSGAYVFFFAILALIVGLIGKVILFEPAQTHLRLPHLTIEIYAAGMLSMLAAVAISRRLAPRRGLLETILPPGEMRRAAIGCVVAGIAIPIFAAVIRAAGITVLLPLASALTQTNRFFPMAIILGTTAEINASGGRRCFSGPAVLAAALLFFEGGVLAFSKEAVFAPGLCWFASCLALRFRFSRSQLVGAVIFSILIVRYMVPFCQYGRSFRDPDATFAQQSAISFHLFLHPSETRRLYLEQAASDDPTEGKLFYDTPHGLLDRLQMVSIDDALFESTEQNGPFGLIPIYQYLANIIPRVFSPLKSTFNWANFYAHQIGMLAPQDLTTSISFSPLGEAFHLLRWKGIFVLAPIVWTLTFLSLDTLCGDLRRSPWGILALALFAHDAPEGLLAGPIYIATYGAFTIAAIAFASAYILPFIANLFTPTPRPIQTFAPRPTPRDL